MKKSLINSSRFIVIMLLITATSLLNNMAAAGTKENGVASFYPEPLSIGATASGSKETPAVIVMRAVIAIGNQLDPAKTAKLDRAQMAPRMNRVMNYMYEAEKAGAKPTVVLENAIELVGVSKQKSKVFWNSELVKSRILDNYADLKNLQIFGSADNLAALKRGNAATIFGGKFSGQQVEWDHIISVNDAPELANNCANLRPLATSLNRSKGAAITADSIETAKAFQAATRWRPLKRSALEKALAKASDVRNPGTLAIAPEGVTVTRRAVSGEEVIANGATVEAAGENSAAGIAGETSGAFTAGEGASAEVVAGVEAAGGEETAAAVAAGVAEGAGEAGILDVFIEVLPFLFAF